MSRIDYPIHDYIRWIQTGSIYRLHHPRIISRIRDNELIAILYTKDDNKPEVRNMNRLFV